MPHVTGSSLVSSPISSSVSATSTVPTSHTSVLHTAISEQGGSRNQQQGTMVSVSKNRRIIWNGAIEFLEKGVTDGANPGRISHNLRCVIFCKKINVEQEVNVDKWSNKLTMQLLPRPFINTPNIKTILKNSSRYVYVFFTQYNEAVQNLNKYMSSNWIGCIQFTSKCELRIMLVLYMSDKQLYMGAIPNDPEGFLSAIRQVFDNHRKQQQTKHKMLTQDLPIGTTPKKMKTIASSSTIELPTTNPSTQTLMKQQNQQQSTIVTSMPPQTPTANSKVVNVIGSSLVSSPISSSVTSAVPTSHTSALHTAIGGQGGPQNQQQLGTVVSVSKDRRLIWRGIIEFLEKGVNPGNFCHNLHCTISCKGINGEQEVNADKWPNKLTMQLMPRPFITTPNVTTILKNSARHVNVFFTQDSEAVQKLNKFMSSSWVGCIQFTSMCELRIMLVLYASDKQRYMGAIPNDQEGFLSALRQLFDNHRKQQQTKHKMMSGGTIASSSTIGLPTTNPSTQSLIMNQTNETSIVASSQLGIRPTMRAPTQPAVVQSNQQQQQQSQTQSNVVTSHNQPTSLSQQQRLSQLEAERQQNSQMQQQICQQHQQQQDEQLLMQCEICSQLQSDVSQIALTPVNQQQQTQQQAWDDANMLEF